MNPSEPVVNPEAQASVAPTLHASAGFVGEPTVAATSQANATVIGYCRECGKALLEGPGVHSALGAIYCDVHRPGAQTIEHPPINSQAASAPWTAPAGASNSFSRASSTASPYHASQPLSPPSSPLHVGASPGLAFVLGMIPGVGAVYNGQYAKGLLHVVILGLAISLNNSGNFEFGPLFGLLITCFWFYMAFDAYHTAKLRRAGMPVDEFSGVFPQQERGAGPRVPVGPIVLIVVGTLLLLSNLEIIEIRRLMRFWPALLIVMGFYMIYERLTEPARRRQRNNANNAEANRNVQ
jgi:putative Mn2+ efflux pump MntP